MCQTEPVEVGLDNNGDLRFDKLNVIRFFLEMPVSK